MRYFLFLAALLIAFPASADSLDGIRIEPEKNIPAYDRDLYDHWIDADGDGQDAREEALIEESLIPVTFQDGKVVAGLWVGPYCGFVTRNPGELDVDHMVPLKQAHLSGGYAWSADKRRDYANALTDNDHLIAVKAGCNRSKSAQDPATWMPPNRTYWCDYLEDWIAIKRKWDLSMDQAEVDAVRSGLRVCGKYRAGDRLDGRH